MEVHGRGSGEPGVRIPLPPSSFSRDARTIHRGVTGAGRMATAASQETASENPEWSYAFWENLSAAQYAERQGGRPIEQAESLYGAG